ncbi:EAL domain-containing protein [Methylobacterium sp. IF7SW-B2]|nr:EAL domain-containing protein [Methylobacterium sp. yr596]MBK3396548.1 EAL domain-containing protein [Methylobacterium ajmalii]MBZ6412912.1 EAL domain-containing protein [Methylobacterium sp.]MBK3409197.1 EAL domain-containing protein [Methylobacterium ajmalii]MBK3424462.1 EAL domain-containing protein [Methylobacterium ajmalii]SFE96654.1 PAS domain S-box-containing protein/diguanylate cyclase (GGDEF) domain-containing protein [Methylobacterium sp. yr596]
MTALYDCIAHNHDLKLVLLAAVVCNLAAATSLTLLDYARGHAGRARRLWLLTGALAGGTGIWATHFIAMLAFSPGLASAYDLGLTGLSLMIAVCMTAAGFWIALRPGLPAAPWLGGAQIGVGVGAMHFTGMAAFEVAGRIAWDPVLVGAALVAGAGLGSLALATTLRDGSVRTKVLGAGLMVAGICSLHFTAMTAAVIEPDPSRALSGTAVPAEMMAVAVAVGSITILVLAFAGLWLHLRDERRSALEGDRMRGLANAAVEGLVVCDGDRIVTVNDSFADLVGVPPDALTGRPLSAILGEAADPLRPGTDEDVEVPEAQLRRADGTLVPVEVIRRVIDFAGRPHAAMAVRDLRARKRAEARIAYLAHHDALTGAPNRASFNDRLVQEIALAQAAGRPLAVLCADLDRFKEVNDLFGHAAGDALLRSVCAAIAGVLAPGQMLARLGGDEFAVLAPNLDAAGAEALGEAILAALRQAETGPAGAIAAASLGLAVYPHDGDDAETLMVQADTALYRAKQEGRGRLRFYEARMGVQVRERRQIEHDLRHAVERGELRVVYQPQTRIDSGEAVGFEALLRWHHPERGTVPPNLFIPIAEETGSILAIGEWVLRETCREAASWDKPLRIAVNVSAVQLHAPGFAELVHEILFATGLSPARLELEITETALIRDLPRALTTLRRIKALGVRIAMDDFGTGYSSLSNLRAFPFDKIKIDASFTRSVDSSEQAATIVRTVLGLGRGLGLPVLAEGVETSAELAFLGAEACQEAQGYLIGRPGPIGGFQHLTAEPDAAEDAA